MSRSIESMTSRSIEGMGVDQSTATPPKSSPLTSKKKKKIVDKWGEDKNCRTVGWVAWFCDMLKQVNWQQNPVQPSGHKNSWEWSVNW